MINEFFTQLNHWALLVSTVAYFLMGWLWFGALFGKMWMAEHAKHGTKLNMKPTTAVMLRMMAISVLGALVVSAATAYLVYRMDSTAAASGVGIGLLTGLGFSASTIGVAMNWEGKSLKLFLLDAGYPLVGAIVCGIILSVWR
jgi:hypothetical protein